MHWGSSPGCGRVATRRTFQVGFPETTQRDAAPAAKLATLPTVRTDGLGLKDAASDASEFKLTFPAHTAILSSQFLSSGNPFMRILEGKRERERE